jgi:NitT/TauT family transport system substrate-binding protein
MNRRAALIAGSAALAVAGVATAWRWPAVARWMDGMTPEPIRLAVSRTYPGTGLLYIARDKGFLQEEGLEASFEFHPSGKAALDSTLAGRTEVATVGDTPFMFAAMRSADVATVGTIAHSTRLHGLVGRADRGVRTARDLRGKSIGVTIGTDGHFLASVILANEAMAASEVRLVNLPPSALAPALVRGDVDAIASWEPWLAMAREALGERATSLFPAGGPAFSFHLVARRAWIAAHPVALRRLLRAVARADDFLIEQPDQSSRIIAEATGVEPAALRETLKSLSLRLRLPQGVFAMLEDQSRWAMAEGLVPTGELPDLRPAVHADALGDVRPGAVSVAR